MQALIVQFFRYSLAVVFACLFGSLVSIVVALTIDVLWGGDVTGGRWPLTIPNIILAIVQGASTGYFASRIAGRNEMFVSAFAQCFPMIAIISVSIILNRDLLAQATLDTRPALWTWIGLAPALVVARNMRQLNKLSSTSDSINSSTASIELPNSNATLISRMRWNLLWYVPFCLMVFAHLVVPNVQSGYQNIALVLHQFTWAIFASPAAYVFLSSVVTSVFLPIQLLLLIPVFFHPEANSYRRRYLWSIVVLVGIVVACCLIQALIWGSFPLVTDNSGVTHLRMIPFFPWPVGTGA